MFRRLNELDMLALFILHLVASAVMFALVVALAGESGWFLIVVSIVVTINLLSFWGAYDHALYLDRRRKESEAYERGE